MRTAKNGCSQAIHDAQSLNDGLTKREVTERRGTCLIPADPATSSKRDGCDGAGSHTSSSAVCPCTASGLCTILDPAQSYSCAHKGQTSHEQQLSMLLL